MRPADRRRTRSGVFGMRLSSRTTVLGLTTALALSCPLVVGAAGPGAAEPLEAPATASRGARADGPPNIVVFLTDDQPSGMLDVMPQVRDLIKQQGVTYPHAIVPTPLCTPSRASLLTGLLPNKTGIFGNNAPTGGWKPFHDTGLEQSTLATRLDVAGYRTALVGKYLNQFGSQSPEGFVPPGWDRFAGLLQTNGSYYSYGVRVKDATGVQDVRYGNDPADYSTGVLASYAVDFVDETPSTTPLFLMYAPVAPHLPTTPEGLYQGTVAPERPDRPDVNEGDISDKPAFMQGFEPIPWPTLTREVARQKETLRSVDDAVARIVSALGDRARDTLFVFMSDNGKLNGSHRMEGKSSPHEQASQVPLIMRWDGHLQSHGTDRRVVSGVDVTATLLDAAGLRRRTADGVSVLSSRRRDGAPVMAASMRFPAYCAWRTRRWLYAEYSGDTGRELYDYRNDPYELDNLAADPRYRATLKRLRDDAKAACDPAPPGFTW